MRRVMSIVVVLMATAALAGPAAAAKPFTDRSASSSANAFWYTTESVSRTSYRTTVWYVGVYAATEGTWADVYQEVTLCRVTRRGEICELELFRIGVSDLASGTFTIAERDLSSAHLDAVFDLQAYDSSWRPVGEATSERVVVDWTGVGALTSEKGTYTIRTECGLFRYSFEGAFRSAEATGSIGGTSLGETYDAWLSSGTSRSFERTC